MAQRRMFSKSITNSSRFLMMPVSARELYFQLGMNADDDGFCEHFTIMRMVEAKPDDLKILAAKEFVKVFDEKVLVIKDWHENNYIRSDRYTASKYLEIYKQELKQISSGIPDGNQKVDNRDTQVRLGKDSIGKYYNKSIQELYEYWLIYPKLIKHTEKSLIKNIKKKHYDIVKNIDTQDIKNSIDNYNRIIIDPEHFWFTYKFTFWHFLEKIDTFLDSADPLNNYKIKDKSQPKEKRAVDFITNASVK